MSKELIKEISRLEKKMNKNEVERDEKVHLLKKQLTSSIVLPAVLIGSVAISIILIRKKKFRNAFAYLTTLTLATSNIYKNAKVAMNFIERLQEHHRDKNKE